MKNIMQAVSFIVSGIVFGFLMSQFVFKQADGGRTPLVEVAVSTSSSADLANSMGYLAGAISDEKFILEFPDRNQTIRWKPSDSPPPVDVATACSSALKDVHLFFKENGILGGEWGLTEIALLPIATDEWFWRVHFQRESHQPGSGYFTRPDYIEIGILMNGDTLIPVRLEEEPKAGTAEEKTDK